MSLFSKLFGWIKPNRKKRKEDYDEVAGFDESLTEYEPSVEQEDYENLFDDEQREKYVRTLLDQMNEASKQMDELSCEYNLVTGYLTDMEEIEAFPDRERNAITDYAKRIHRLESEKDSFRGKPSYLSEEEYCRVEKMEPVIEEGIRKITEAEEFRQIIRRDLKKLDVERNAYEYRKRELAVEQQNLKGIGIIGFVSLIIGIVLMFLMQFALKMDTTIGYLLLACAATIFLAVIYVKHSDAKRENVYIGKMINKLILLQNRVKIKYVNNTNLLDYLYLKYETSSANALSMLWENYLLEREERRKFEQTIADLDYYKKELVQVLTRLRIRDPYIWLHQSEALFNHNEMVEIRHGLISRRQQLRKQMEYNKKIATGAQQKLKDIVAAYPAFAKNVIKYMDMYE